jgi:hypothetical protein
LQFLLHHPYLMAKLLAVKRVLCDLQKCHICLSM